MARKTAAAEFKKGLEKWSFKHYVIIAEKLETAIVIPMMNDEEISKILTDKGISNYRVIRNIEIWQN